MSDSTNRAAGSGRHRWRAGARAARVVVIIAVLAVIGAGYLKSVDGHPAAPARLAPIPIHIPAGPGRFAAEAAVAVTQLQRKAGNAYLHSHSWQAASSLSATIGFMRATGSRAYLSDLSAIYRGHFADGAYHTGFYDDMGWWVLTWIKAYDLTGDTTYIREARRLFATMSRGWTRVCGGGVVWNQHRRYKNAITNEEFMQAAVLLHEATPGDTWYARWALRDWAWFSASGMLTRSGLVVDGLAPDCRPNLSSQTWTYNQGMLVGAMVSLATLTGHKSFLVTAGKVAHAVIRSPILSPGGILREPCAPLQCGRDAPMFKGIFMQNLKLLYDRVGGAGYQRYMRRNAVAAWADDRQGATFGISWTGPFLAPTLPSQASALDLLTTQIP